MTRFALILTLLLVPVLSNAQLPSSWGPDFTISLSHDGSMSGASTQIKYSYDECQYEYHSGRSAPVKYTFKMTDGTRSEILTRLREFNLDSIKSLPGTIAVNDGWSQSLVIGSMYIEGGTSAQMSDDDKSRFLGAFNYLQQLAIDNQPKKGKGKRKK